MKNGKKAVIDFASYEEASRFADEKGGSISLLKKTDGQDWEDLGFTSHAISVWDADFGDDAVIFCPSDAAEYWANEVEEFTEDMEGKEKSRFEEAARKELAILESLKEDEVMVRFDRGSCEVYKERMMLLHEDNKTYAVGVVME